MQEQVRKQELRVCRISKDIDLPQYTRSSDVAFDLRSAEEKILKPGEKQTIKTGIKLAIPDGHAGLIWDRSGIASKHGIHCLAGVIDSAYRGEIGVVLKNLGESDFLIEKNMRIAQMLIQPVATPKLVEVENLDEDTDRKANGFGSSGYF
jgi:dUTP pyrophosphatase